MADPKPPPDAAQPAPERDPLDGIPSSAARRRLAATEAIDPVLARLPAGPTAPTPAALAPPSASGLAPTQDDVASPRVAQAVSPTRRLLLLGMLAFAVMLQVGFGGVLLLRHRLLPSPPPATEARPTATTRLPPAEPATTAPGPASLQPEPQRGASLQPEPPEGPSEPPANVHSTAPRPALARPRQSPPPDLSQPSPAKPSNRVFGSDN